MALYSEKVMDHFRNPRNIGVIENADGIGEVGNAKCGDIMKIYLKIDDERIEDVKSLVNSGKTIIISTHKPLLYKDIYSITYKFDEGVCNEKKRRKKQTT